jgi:cobaltochelatase CobN
LTALSTWNAADLGPLEALLDCGGVTNFAAALEAVKMRVDGSSAPLPDPTPLPNFGIYCEGALVCPRQTLDSGRDSSCARACLLAARCDHSESSARSKAFASAVIVFYRSHVLAGDVAPIDALMKALATNGVAVSALYVSSLKAPDAAEWLRAELDHRKPSVIINATAFAARDRDDGASPLDGADCTVLQVAMLGPPKSVWDSSPRGLNAADLAMHVVLPELDGRVFAGVISFKESVGGADTFGCDTVRHRPFDEGVAHVAALAANFATLKTTPRSKRRAALVLSTYPGRPDQIAHAVGLDGLQSALLIARQMQNGGFAVANLPQSVGALTAALDQSAAVAWSLEGYVTAFATLPIAFREAVIGAWGEPSSDQSLRDGQFQFASIDLGALTIALQPDRGLVADRKAAYHDPATPPCHAYVAFYLWLRSVRGMDALIHLGAHGTLEWLPGKAVGLGESCAPQVLIGATPVIYPFIVNDPGEAAQAKRRIAAITLGHKPPPQVHGELSAALVDLERLTDEFASADGLDRRRRKALTTAIIDAAVRAGIAECIGLTTDMALNDALTRIDAFLCDVKEMSLNDGLHVLDQCEIDAIMAALDGAFIAPGPAGAPSRGRADVLPTGRNMFTLDPRGLPTPMAWSNGQRAADAIIERYVSDNGDYPRAIVMDLWGSATLRTGGEELATALALLGVRPVWDTRSFRVTGIESNPIAVIGRPRVDVTLRISGLFRDMFATQLSLFESAVNLVATMNEAHGDNPLAGSPVEGLNRIFGPASGSFGAGVMAQIDSGAWQSAEDLGRSYLAASSQAYRNGGVAASDGERFEARVEMADAFVHVQDHRELDLLTGGDFAAHEGGFAAAARATGNTRVALYHGDTGTPDAPKIRTLHEEVARVVHGRAANPRWIAGQMRHGFRGAAEMAAGVDAAFAFAATARAVDSGGFERLYAAYLGDPAVAQFIERENPVAIAAMKQRFDDAIARGLWQPRRNDVAARTEREAAE